MKEKEKIPIGKQFRKKAHDFLKNKYAKENTLEQNQYILDALKSQKGFCRGFGYQGIASALELTPKEDLNWYEETCNNLIKWTKETHEKDNHN